MKVAELREELSSRGLPVAGKKAELVERLEASEVEDVEEVIAEEAAPEPVRVSTCPGCKRSDCCYVRLA